jgi:hypothetical protein
LILFWGKINFLNTELKVHWSCVKVGYEEITKKKKLNVVATKMDMQEKME